VSIITFRASHGVGGLGLSSPVLRSSMTFADCLLRRESAESSEYSVEAYLAGQTRHPTVIIAPFARTTKSIVRLLARGRAQMRTEIGGSSVCVRGQSRPGRRSLPTLRRGAKCSGYACWAKLAAERYRTPTRAAEVTLAGGYGFLNGASVSAANGVPVVRTRLYQTQRRPAMRSWTPPQRRRIR
jgi:hypothetical protein